MGLVTSSFRFVVAGCLVGWNLAIHESIYFVTHWLHYVFRDHWLQLWLQRFVVRQDDNHSTWDCRISIGKPGIFHSSGIPVIMAMVRGSSHSPQVATDLPTLGVGDGGT